MSWLSKYLKITPDSERGGITLEPENIKWELSPTRNLAAFFRGLLEFLPSQATLYMEGFPEENITAYLEAHQLTTGITKVAVDTVWPRPVWHHLPITKDVMEGLARLVENSGGEQVTTHIHAYKDQEMLLAWHDAMDLPILVSRKLPDERVKEFSAKLGVHCKRVDIKWSGH